MVNGKMEEDMDNKEKIKKLEKQVKELRKKACGGTLNNTFIRTLMREKEKKVKELREEVLQQRRGW